MPAHVYRITLSPSDTALWRQIVQYFLDGAVVSCLCNIDCARYELNNLNTLEHTQFVKNEWSNKKEKETLSM